MSDAAGLALELSVARAGRATVPVLPSARGLDLSGAYAVEAELRAERVAAGQRVVGLKVGYANKAVWRALKLQTLVWAHMYDDTVTEAHGGRAGVSIGRLIAPKIEPEIVVALASPLPSGLTDAAAVLEHVAWIALGFEIIDCPYPDWKFQPPDFVAAYGLHAALVVGEPTRVTAETIPTLVDALAGFTVTLDKDGAAVATGGGKNSLRSPALCVAELATALAARGDTTALGGGALISTGTLTDSQLIAAGETWGATVDGLDVRPITLRVEP
jgi:2-oxo-3-hexenedioate decarboxylase